MMATPNCDAVARNRSFFHSNNSVISLTSLNEPARLFAAMTALLEGEALAIVSTIDTALAIKAARVAAEIAVKDYRVAPGFAYQADAPPLFQAKTEADLINYLVNGAEYEARFAARMAPLASPAALVEQDIKAAWPGGVRRLRLRDQDAPFGVVRHLQPDSDVGPHTDNSDLDKPSIPEFKRARTNFSAVIYLQPSVGGELLIWRQRLETKEAINALRREDHAYALDHRRLGPADVVLRPEVGQVVIFDAKHVHAVGPNRGTVPRVTQSGFIAVGEPDEVATTYY